jgi:hypothetical protein
MIRLPRNIGGITNRYSDLVARLKGHDEIGAELIPVTETGTQVSLKFSDKDLAWVKSSFRKLARLLMSGKLREARFTTKLTLNVHVLNIILDINLINRQLVFNIAQYNGGNGVAGLPPGAVISYQKLQGFLGKIQAQNIQNVPMRGILSLLNKLEKKGIDEQGEQNIEITAGAKFFLNKNPLVARLSREVSRADDVFVSVYLFSEKLKRTLAKNTLSGLESQFFKADKKAVIVVFGARGVLQGDFLSVCGRCSANQLETAFESPDKKKRAEFDERSKFRSRNCSLQLENWLMPESLSTTVIDADQGLLDIHYELKAWEAMLAIYSLANRVSKSKSGQYEVYFEGHRMVSFTVQKERLRGEYEEEYSREGKKKKASQEEEKEGDEEEGNVRAILMLYDLAYENAAYDKLVMTRDVVTVYTDTWEVFIGKASKIGKSARASYRSYLKTKVESYFETRRKIRELIGVFAREAASEVARLTKEVNENIYKTAGLIAAAVIAALIKPNNSLLILSIGGVVVVLFLLIVLRYYLPTMLTQFKNRQEQYEDDVRSFAQVLEEDEIEEFIDDKTVKEQKELFRKKFNRAKQFYYVSIGFVVIALAVFFIVQQATST